MRTALQFDYLVFPDGHFRRVNASSVRIPAILQSVFTEQVHPKMGNYKLSERKISKCWSSNMKNQITTTHVKLASQETSS